MMGFMPEGLDLILKRVLKFNNRCKQSKDGLQITAYDGVTEEDVIALYRAFSAKLDGIRYAKELSAEAKALREGETIFSKMSLEKKCEVLGKILCVFQCNSTTPVNLDVIDGPKQAGRLRMSANIKQADNIVWIVQSITGFFEKRIPLWQGGK